ncbi:hypothetical protein [uncultured Roseobacter sp.]|uniref:hypothetical protein n=1 Tax=uncultured Roseobacter sp. TaxID=114847 RepID=UPI00261E4E99|nr:hypothetical protein [uncultured Roseobacter sp.]
MQNSKTVSSEDLVRAYHISANLVAAYGPDFVPAFERMEREVERAKKLEKAVARAERVVKVVEQTNRKESC